MEQPMNRTAASPGETMMNHSTSVRRRPRRTWRAGPRPARTAAAIVAMAVLALLAAACGGSPPSTGSGGSPAAGGSATSPSAVAYSACIRPRRAELPRS
jgi:hypothetical protein